MKTLHLLLVLLLVSLIGCGGGNSFGIGGTAPLGDFGTMDTFLAKTKKLDRSQRTIEYPEIFDQPELYERLKAFETYEYQDHANQGSGVRQRVIIVVDPTTKKVHAVGGVFFSGAAAYGPRGTKTETFVARHWVAATGQEPEFTKLNRPGRFVDEYLIHEFKGPAFKGKWLKQPASGNASMANTIWDTVLLWRN